LGRAARLLILTRALGALALLALLVPSPASAGRTARSGNETASIAVTASSQPGASASTRGARLRFVVKLGTVNGKRSTEYVTSISLRGPAGMRFNSSALPRCIESRLFTDKTYRCPGRSVLGTGTAKADARPAVANLINARLTAYNSSNDFDATNHYRRAKPGVVLNANLGGGNFVGVPLDYTAPNALLLEQPPPPPSGQALYTIASLDITVGGLGARGTPYIQMPSTCPRSAAWRFTLTERFRSGRRLAATHDLRCHRAR
jgi:hypothetical protein